MKKLYLTIVYLGIANLSLANELQFEKLKSDFEEVSIRWKEVSEEVKTYSGLKRYCNSEPFRSDVSHTLQQVHLFDSMLYRIVSEEKSHFKIHAVRKAMRKVEDFEKKYDVLLLHEQLSEECGYQRKAERNFRRTRLNTGLHSFDNQVIVTEVYLRRYVRNVDKMMKELEKTIYHLDKRRHQ